MVTSQQQSMGLVKKGLQLCTEMSSGPHRVWLAILSPALPEIQEGQQVTAPQDSQRRCRTEVETSRLSLAKGSIRGMQLFCPKSRKHAEPGGRDTCGPPLTLCFSEMGGPAAR